MELVLRDNGDPYTNHPVALFGVVSGVLLGHCHGTIVRDWGNSLAFLHGDILKKGRLNNTANSEKEALQLRKELK